MTLNSATANREGADDRDEGTARRTATVRYRVTVYATVDLDTGAVTEVFEDLDSIRQDGLGSVEAADDSAPLTSAELISAVQIAESVTWPAWTR